MSACRNVSSAAPTSRPRTVAQASAACAVHSGRAAPTAASRSRSAARIAVLRPATRRPVFSLRRHNSSRLARLVEAPLRRLAAPPRAGPRRQPRHVRPSPSLFPGRRPLVVEASTQSPNLAQPRRRPRRRQRRDAGERLRHRMPARLQLITLVEHRNSNSMTRAHAAPPPRAPRAARSSTAAGPCTRHSGVPTADADVAEADDGRSRTAADRLADVARSCSSRRRSCGAPSGARPDQVRHRLRRRRPRHERRPPLSRCRASGGATPSLAWKLRAARPARAP